VTEAARDREQDLLVRVMHQLPVDPNRDASADAVDWERLRRVAGPALAPYLVAGLERAQLLSRVPSDVRDQLTAVRRANGMAHLLRLRALRGALAALDGAGIQVIVLKGMALAHLVYPDPTLRPMQDIDLWVPPDRLDPAASALRGAGFRFPRRTYEGLRTPGARTATVDRALELPDTPILFELHGSLPSWGGLPSRVSETAWARARELMIDDLHTRVLAPEDQLLHLGLHLSKRHLFRAGLISLVDLQLVLGHWRDHWDWNALVDDYRSLGIGTWMRLALQLSRDLVGAAVPDAVIAALPEPEHWHELEHLALEQLWNAGSFVPHALERFIGATQGPNRVTWARNRLLTYLRGNPWEAGRRLWFDIALKIPRYARLWMRGELRGPRFREHVRLARQRARLEALVAGAERAWAARSG
jgi:hypothetical protein